VSCLARASAHLYSRKEKLKGSWRETCSSGREGGAKEERNGCYGQKNPWVLPAPLTLQREGLCLSQCRCAHSSHCLENWALEAGAASCSVMGSNALQVWAMPRIPTQSPFQQCAQPPCPPRSLVGRLLTPPYKSLQFPM
jgi:hypothetical protein